LSEAVLNQIATDVIRMAREKGASGAECTVSEGDEFTVLVRMSEVENLKEAGSRGAGLRVMAGRRTGSAYTSDLSSEGLTKMVDSAMELAKITSEDPHAGLPDACELGKYEGDLKLYYEDPPEVDALAKIEAARQAEAAAFAVDPRIFTTEGASFDSYRGARAFANSDGFRGSYRSSSCSLSCVPVAKQDESMERDYWYSSARAWSMLENPIEIGRKAAARALRRLGARKVPTQKAAIVFEPRIARSLLGHIFEAVSGDSIYRDSSFLAGKLGQKIAHENLTVIDDGTLPGLFGSSPFDDEGVPSRRTVVIEKGVLKSFLLNSYTARKLGLKTTGNASRGITGNASVGHGNFYIPAGEMPPEEIIKQIKSGLYVTELIGFGVNIVTGDYSRGAAGVWIENGELTYPVSEVTIAGSLIRMLEQLGAIGSDLEFRGSMAAPTLMIPEMTISGQ
jgi:PmbA protein